MKGRIHSFETFGTLDGPGIRFVLFMQGCALRCQYCHNPDSWELRGGTLYRVEDILREIEPYLPYYESSGGGITVTGGEPGLQPSFVKELFQQCQQRWNLHTALDTAGYFDFRHAASLLDVTNLVMLDIKLMDPNKHRQLTGVSNERVLEFARLLSRRGSSMRIRYVLVPGVTDGYDDLAELGAFVGTLQHVEKIEVLPYHRMGVYKWRNLDLEYPLAGVPEPTHAEVQRAEKIIREHVGV